jgi:hypothetical protein
LEGGNVKDCARFTDTGRWSVEGRGRGVLALALLALLGSTIVAACGGGSKAPAATPTLTASQAEQQLKRIVLQAADIGDGYTQDSGRARSDAESAKARPDSAQAAQQYAQWGQVLAYDVAYSTPATADLVFNAKIARVMNSATLFGDGTGASSALAYAHGLSPATVADFLVNDGAGTKISDTQVVKDLAFPAKGDESFAWRISGKATFTNGFTVNFIADAVFIREGRIDGTVTAVALGQAPQRDQLERLVDTFVERAGANQ